MADINPTLPSVGEANSTADPKVLSALSTIVSTINALDADNLASNAITEAKITAGVVSAAKIKAEAWTSYTATVSATSVTLGTGGTNVAYYIQYGKTVHAQGVITLGTGGSFTGTDIRIALPATAVSGRNQLGFCTGYDSSGADLYAGAVQAVGGQAYFVCRFHGDPSTALGATTPFAAAAAWADSDVLQWAITYEAA